MSKKISLDSDISDSDFDTMSPLEQSNGMDRKTWIWWSFLRGVSVLNMVLLAGLHRSLDTTLPYRKVHLVLATIYVFVCGFRSFFPRVDLERTVLVQHWLSNIALGRASATVAEMSLTLQLACVLLELSEVHTEYRILSWLAWFIVPMIGLAQVFCWCGVLSGNHLWHAGEESLWTVLGLVLGGACWMLREQATSVATYVGLGSGLLASLSTVYVCGVVDVPMYITRWRIEKHVGREYTPIASGFNDAATRMVTTGAWNVWKHEVTWMTPYFSAAVWGSLLLAKYPVSTVFM